MRREGERGSGHLTSLGGKQRANIKCRVLSGASARKSHISNAILDIIRPDQCGLALFCKQAFESRMGENLLKSLSETVNMTKKEIVRVQARANIQDGH